MASKSFYRVVDADDNEVDAAEYTSLDAARISARSYKGKVVEDVYEWDETVPVEGADYTEPEYATVEVALDDCHGQGTIEMLRCRECDEPLGQMHKAGCELVQPCGNCGEPADAIGRNDDGYCAQCRALANARCCGTNIREVTTMAEYRFSVYDSANGSSFHGEEPCSYREECESDAAAVREAEEFANMLAVNVERKKADGTWEGIDIVVPIVKGFGHVGPDEGVESADTTPDVNPLAGTWRKRELLMRVAQLARVGILTGDDAKVLAEFEALVAKL